MTRTSEGFRPATRTRRVVIECEDGAERASQALRTKLSAGRRVYLCLPSVGAPPDADFVFLVDSGFGRWALSRAQALRRIGFKLGIVILTHDHAALSFDIVHNAGADDWLDLGRVGNEELHARLEALARRLLDDDDDELVGLFPGEHAVQIGPTRITLGERGFQIFAYLAARRGHWVPTREIMENALDTAHDPASSVVRFQVLEVRRRLGPLHSIIEGRTRSGYRMNLRSTEVRGALSGMQAQSGEHASPRLVLLVDDDPIVCGTLERYLKRRGFAVVKALDCREARTRNGNFWAALIDVRLPDGDGVELGRELLASRSVRRVTFMSGRVTGADRARAAGVGEVLDKLEDVPAFIDGLDDFWLDRAG
jgi:DNA-binding response OmpR family regulator